MSVLVRPATPDDLDGLIRLLEELNGFPYASSRAVQEQTLAQILATPGRHVLVAESGDGDLVGTAEGIVLANLSRDVRPYCLIENVVVTAPARGSGVGRLLLQRLLDLADEAGCYKVQLVSGAHRPQAHAFYEALGFDGDVSRGFRRYL